MPTALTHLGFVETLRKNRATFFKKLDLRHLVSGALFPDYYGFYNVQLKLKPEFFYEIRNQKGITFGKRMYSLAKTNSEKSFAIGFITHSVIDKHFHNYFKKHKITSTEEHLMLEFFYDCKFKDFRISPVIYPKDIIGKTLKKYYKDIDYTKTHITKLKLLGYYLFLKEVQGQIINKKYIFKNKLSRMDFIAIPFYKKPINLKKLITPDHKLKKKHMKKLEKEFVSAKKEMLKIIDSIDH